MTIKEKLTSAITNVVETVQEEIDSKINAIQNQYLRLTDEEKQTIEDEKAKVSAPNSVESMGEIQNQIDKISIEVFRDYLSSLSENYIPDSCCNITDVNEYLKNNIRAINISKFVIDSKEKSIDKLKNVYNVLSGSTCNLALVFSRTPNECSIYLAVGNKENSSDPNDAKRFYNSLKSAFNGNFPGTNCLPTEIDDNAEQNASIELSKKLQKTIANGAVNTVAVITNIAAEKSTDFISQGIEKLIDGFIPKTDDENYTIILLAEPKKPHEIDELKKHYGALYTLLSPFSVWQKNYSYAETVALMKNASANVGINIGVNLGVKGGISGGLGIGGSKTSSYTGTESLTLTHTIYNVKNTLERIEKQVKRLEMCEGLGMWDFATYVLSKDCTVVNNISNMYRSLTQGEDSYIEKSAVNIWDNADESLKKSLSFFIHPEFTLNIKSDILPRKIKATTNVSGIELAYAMNLPNKSVSGFPVIECAEFGRNVISYDTAYNGNLEIGCIYHMHKKEENNHVKLNKDSLVSHTFITGSTGSGKSNTVFEILHEAIKDNNTKFLVVEPAKGEYKNVFGKTAKVYGTNPKITEILRINPFSFPENIAVNEHIDRLIEIFNVCWPMYAAMPAILKDAVIRAYESAGWDLELSENKYDNRIFPSFADVLSEIRLVLQESEYSSDNKGDYTGALVTRLESLTNGINGQIFNPSALSDEKLFDENVIVDLSRVGSMETKAMIMGLLVMKLQEYRLSSGNPDEKELKHITVLEEAHNLLKRTSTEQSSESSNILGKSVEMLANSIAELRAFGEGFIIADQSPGLLDMSVIRNTNTKIIHKLPDFSDRELVGKAAGLNDDQIIELAKLQIGVAAFYQNNWINPVLCKVNEFKKERKEKYENIKNEVGKDYYVQKAIANILINPKERIDFDLNKFINSNISGKAKTTIIECVNSSDLKQKAHLASILLDRNIQKMLKPANERPFDDKSLEQIQKYIEEIYEINDIQNINRLIWLAVLSQEQTDRNYKLIRENFQKHLRGDI